MIAEGITSMAASVDPRVSRVLQAEVANRLFLQVKEAVTVWQGVEPNLDLLVALQGLEELPIDRRQSILLHPCCRYWLQALRRVDRLGNSDLGVMFARRLVDFIWSEHVSLRRPVSVTTSADEDGGLRCPSLACYVELGEAYANQPIEITANGNDATLRCADGLVIQIPSTDFCGEIDDPPSIEAHGYRIVESKRVGDGRIEVTNRDPWLRVQVTGTNQRTDGTRFFGSDRALYPTTWTTDTLVEAIALLKAHWRDAFEDMCEYTKVIVPVDPGLRGAGRDVSAEESCSQVSTHFAFTVSSRQGAIYIGPAPVDSTVEMLLHENAHVKLRQIQALDPLLVDPLDESCKVSVPWRPDPRPIPGILEGLFVFSHVAEFEWRRWYHEPNDVQLAALRKRLEGLSFALRCVEANAQLTAAGVEFVAAMSEWVSALRSKVSVA